MLGSVKTDWENPEWQQRWASPAAFASTFLDLTQDAQGQAEVGNFCSMLAKCRPLLLCLNAFRYHQSCLTGHSCHLSPAIHSIAAAAQIEIAGCFTPTHAPLSTAATFHQLTSPGADHERGSYCASMSTCLSGLPSTIPQTSLSCMSLSDGELCHCLSPAPPTELNSHLMQVRGQEGRWLLYHHLHLLERCAKRMPPSQPLAPANSQGAPILEPVMVPGAPGWHALNGHIAWFLPQLLLICGCMQSLWGPEVRLPAMPDS